MALKDLEDHGRKTKHWVWWAFPTTKVGFSEMGPSTCVTAENAHFLFHFASKYWKMVLEKICDLIEKKGGIAKVIPQIDHSRIGYFIQFWKNV